LLERLTHPDGVLVLPDGAPSASALVLSGVSGAVEEERCRLLAAHGVAALSMQWFGGVGQPPGICEVPLESFRPALDRLADLSPRLTVFGVSKGAEAALLLAARDARISLCVAMSPSSVVWANVGAGLDGVTSPYRSSWTWQGEPLPFVPYDDTWTVPRGDWPSYLALYERSLRAFAHDVDAARIPVDLIGGEVIVTAGGDDQVWPSAWGLLGAAHPRPTRHTASTSGPLSRNRSTCSRDERDRPRIAPAELDVPLARRRLAG
jgi:hypothetical protein